MLFGASSYIWVSPFSSQTLDQFRKAKDMGFDLYELSVEKPEMIDIRAVEQAASKAGIQCTICGAFGPDRDISSDDEAVRINGVQYIKSLIDMAEAVSSPYVSGPMYSAVGKARLQSSEEKERQTSWAVQNMRLVSEYAAIKGVKLAVEPLNRFETDFMNTVDQGLDFLSKIDMDNVGLLLDTFHMNIEEKDVPAAIRKAGNKLFEFHACGSDRGTPGEDHLDWAGIVQALKDIQYDGPVVIESFTTEITEIAKAVSLWRPLAESQDALAANGLKFLKRVFQDSHH
jgi:D-psicose/D-tagatose/L-ribulose 3-epimerase